jgi:hypothetical protein
MHNETPGSAIVIRRDDPPRSPILAEAKPLRYSLPELKQVGEIMFASGMFRDLKSVQQAMVKLLAGAELGYGPFRSLEAFHVIEGKPSETAAEISARIKASAKYDYNHFWINAARERLDPIKDASSEVFGCVIVVEEMKGTSWKEREPVVFTLDDAKTAGLLGKDNWRKYSRDMLFARAISAAGRQHCADLFGGPAYTPDDLGANVVIDAAGKESLAPARQRSVEAKQTLEHAEPEVSLEERMTKGRQSIAIFCRNRGITDERRHRVSSVLFGRNSTKELNLAELQTLSRILQAYAKAEMQNEPEESFEAWATWQRDEAQIVEGAV